MMVESLKHEGTLHSSSDLLKICGKMVSSWSAQVLWQAGDTVWAWCFPSFVLFEDLAHVIFAYLQCRCGGGGGGAGGVNGVFQTCNRTHSDRLPVVDSPECWGMVSCNW